MSQHFVWFLLLSLTFATSFTYCLTNQTRYYNDIDPNSSIAFVNDYLSAIIIRNSTKLFNLSTKYQIFSMLNNKTSSNYESLKIVSILPDEKLIQLWKNLPHVKNQVILNNFERGACQIYHPLEDFDVILTSRNLFLQKFRIFRQGKGIRKLGEDYYESSDFQFIDLFPYTVLQVDSDGDSLIKFNISSEKPNCQEPMQSYEYEENLLTAYSILTLNTSSTISNEDLLFLRQWTNFNIKLISVTNQKLLHSDLAQQFNLTTNSTFQDLTPYLLPSSCFICKSNLCLLDLEFKDVEYWVIPQIFFVIIYLFFLIFSGAFTQPSMKRRLLTPFLPILMLYFMFALADVFTPWCRSVLFITVGYFLTFCSLVNVFTYLRLYYLRNLYRLFSNSGKFSSVLSGFIPGVLFTVVLPAVLSILISTHYISIAFVLDRPLVFTLNLNVGTTMGVCCLSGFIVILSDILINRKKWKEKGLRYMLFFDDPFLIRIDMMLLSFNLLIIILMTIFSFNRHAIYFLRTILFLTFILICGGQCIVKYLIEKLRGIKNEQESSFEEFWKNDDFRRIQREYCIKELSLENYNFFFYLNELRSKASRNLTLDIMKEVENQFLTGAFEVNVSASCKKSFNKIKKSLEEGNGQELKIQELFTLFEMEILSNLKDTFSRMEKTVEFQNWLKVYNIQKQNNIC